MKEQRKVKELNHLSEIYDAYDTFVIDLWGVIHNGIELNKEAVNVLTKISEEKNEYILLTNAPRPNKSVKNFLEKMGLEKAKREKVFTSGEAALSFLKKKYSNESFYHIGPPRDFDLFLNFKKQKTDNINECSYFLCTGLFENHDDDLNYYRNLLNKFSSKKMICTNPDLIVDRGNRRELCAGSVAMVFEKIGGKVIYFGKPFPEVYNQSIDTRDKKILCIGDNLNTDIRGANLQNFSSLFISSGIHRNEFDENQPEILFNKYNVTANYFQSNLKW